MHSQSIVAVAVSGGGDSTALLCLLTEAKKPIATKIIALTVDHGLRNESADEARHVGAFCASLGIDHQILHWREAKPASGLSAAARMARYRLLAEAAVASGASTVLTGHTADDQVETVLMREKRGEGVGLAGIAPATLFEGKIWFMRPLLAVRRATLRDYLLARAVGWIDDPSNENLAFERARTRRDVARDGEEQAMRVLRRSEDAAQNRLRLGFAAADLLRRLARIEEGGRIWLEPSLLVQDRNAAAYCLRILLATVGGLDRLPDQRRTAALFDKLTAGGRGRFSLGRNVIAAGKTGVELVRESRSALATGGRQDGKLRSPWRSFLPSFDLAPACAVAELIADDRPPALPWPQKDEP